jgi:hypothetical protein
MGEDNYIRQLQTWIWIANAAIILSSVLAILLAWRLGEVEGRKGTKKLQTALKRRGILAQVVVVFCTVLALVFGWLLGGAQDRRSERQSQAADLRIRQTERATAEANRASAVLRVDLESAKATTRGKQSELAIEQQKLAEAQQKLARAEQDRAQAQMVLERTLQEVRLRQMPRTLTASRRTRLIYLLRSIGPHSIDVECVSGDGEAHAFATELNVLLRTAGWTTTQDVGQDIMIPSPSGARLVLDNFSVVPDWAVRLQHALGDAGVRLPILASPGRDQAKVRLIIGHREQRP